ncbi:unnamed protein product [Blepharisma stoltei]|uniref:Uncharacterized protein n=1 Tax=Blepharisma stoltei TaxID=1481888 RepID=A0AAU9JKH1_9CILI|nr:unnamed protein product [Blepharisma stoltei]
MRAILTALFYLISIHLSASIPHPHEITNNNVKNTLKDIDNSSYGSMLLDLIQLQSETPDSNASLFTQISQQIQDSQKSEISKSQYNQVYCDDENKRLFDISREAELTIVSNNYKIKYEIQPELDSKRQRKMRLEKEMDLNKLQRKKLLEEKEQENEKWSEKKSIIDNAINNCEELYRIFNQNSFLQKDLTATTLVELKNQLEEIGHEAAPAFETLVELGNSKQSKSNNRVLASMILQIKSDLEVSKTRMEDSVSKNQENLLSYLGSLEEVYQQYKNEYDNSTPKIISLEGKIRGLNNEIENLNKKQEEVKNELAKLHDWCEFQKKKYLEETQKRQEKLDMTNAVKSILFENNEEIEEFVSKRMSKTDKY